MISNAVACYKSWDIYGMHLMAGIAVYNLDTMDIYHIETLGM